MSDPEILPPQSPAKPSGPAEMEPDEPSQGPSLKLLYGLLALAFALAIGFALMIVRPFYQRR